MPTQRRDYYDSKGRRKGWSTSYRPLSRKESQEQNEEILKIATFLVIAAGLFIVLTSIYWLAASIVHWVASYAIHPFPGNIFAWNVYVLTAGPWKIGASLYSYICASPLTAYHNLNLIIFISATATLILVPIYVLSGFLRVSKEPRRFWLGISTVLLGPAMFSLMAWLAIAGISIFEWIFTKY